MQHLVDAVRVWKPRGHFKRRFRVQCECWWVTPWRDTLTQAEADFVAHVAERGSTRPGR